MTVHFRARNRPAWSVQESVINVFSIKNSNALCPAPVQSKSFTHACARSTTGIRQLLTTGEMYPTILRRELMSNYVCFDPLRSSSHPLTETSRCPFNAKERRSDTKTFIDEPDGPPPLVRNKGGKSDLIIDFDLLSRNSSGDQQSMKGRELWIPQPSLSSLILLNKPLETRRAEPKKH